jgi:hypothetical protein
MLDRPRFWWRVLSRGTTSLNTWLGLFSSVVLVLSVAAGITVPLLFHVSHWVTAVMILVGVVVVMAEGSYLEWQDARSALEGMRRERDEALEGAQRAALTAAVAAQAGGTLRPDPVDWNAYCDYFPPGYLAFNLRHRLDNLAAVFAFSAVQCAVTDPDGVRTEAEDRNINNMRALFMVQYTPSNFPGAPPVQSGTYRFVWTGQDAKGTWHEITRGSYEVPLPEAAGPGDVDVPS